MIKTIKKLTATLLENSTKQFQSEKILNEIHYHFQQITSITGFDHKIEHLAAVPTAKGKALGLNYAAQCLLDYRRTLQFLKGIISAINEKQKQYPGELITIFYAGCGPYAPFITLVASQFNPEEIRFSLLEINKNSLDSAKKLIDYLELSNYVKEYYLADAVTFKVPNASSFHILISETLDALLYRECYVPIVFNLLHQFDEEVILIPENVLINLSLIPNTENKDELDLGTIFDTRKTIASHIGLDNLPLTFDDKKFDLKSFDMSLFKNFILDTKVHVRNKIWLERNESPLTVAYEMPIKQPFRNESIIFTYHLEPEIELKCKFQ